MFEALAQGASHPAVAAWLGLGTAAVAVVVVAMAWSVNARQIRLAELLVRRQFPVISRNGAAKEGAAEIEGASAAKEAAGGKETAGGKEGAARAKSAAAGGQEGPAAAGGRAGSGAAGGRAGHGAAGGHAGPGAGGGHAGPGAGGAHPSRVPPEVIEGPDEVVAGEQARFRVQSAGPHQVVSWAVGGGGAVSHGPDPGHPGDLLLIAEQPGDLTIIARVREGLNERRATKTVTAVAEVTVPTPPFSLRLFLHGWGLIVVAVLIVGFAGALNALGNFTSSDFIAVAVPLAALLGVLAVARGPGAGEPGNRPGHGSGKRHGQP